MESVARAPSVESSLHKAHCNMGLEGPQHFEKRAPISNLDELRKLWVQFRESLRKEAFKRWGVERVLETLGDNALDWDSRNRPLCEFLL